MRSRISSHVRAMDLMIDIFFLVDVAKNLNCGFVNDDGMGDLAIFAYVMNLSVDESF